MSEREKVTVFIPRFVALVPDIIEDGVLYISEKYSCAIHLCACGCGGKTVMSIPPMPKAWKYKNDDGSVTFSPSISNAQFCPNKAHYFIERNAVRWA